MVETPIFIPFRKESQLRRQLQEVDDALGEATNSPAVRFVERCEGGKLIDSLTSSNPWAKEWFFECQKCLPGQGRLLIAGEIEERPDPEPGKLALSRPSREETMSFPKYMTEGVGYSI